MKQSPRNQSHSIAIRLISFLLSLAVGTNAVQAAPPGASDQPAPVTVLTIEPQSVELTQTIPGRIAAALQAEVRPQVNGLVVQRLFEEGAYVKQGDQLYQIDAKRYEAALSSAQASVQSAQAAVKTLKAKLNRYKELLQSKAVSQQEYDDIFLQQEQAIAEVAVAQTQVDIAQLNVDYTKVYAPISGQIGRSLVTVGSLVTESQAQPLALITQLDPLYIDMQKSAFHLDDFRQQLQGNNIRVDVRYGDGNKTLYPLPGKLEFFDVNVDQTTGSIGLRASVPNPHSVLLPGMFVQGIVHTGQMQALLVPQRAAVRLEDGTMQVWVVSQNQAKPQAIEATQTYKDQWIVQSGLKAGDQVVIEGYQKLAPDAKVAPEPWRSESSPDVKNNSNQAQR